MGLSDLWKGKKKYYSYNNPTFEYAQGYQPNSSMLSYLDPNAQDWNTYGQYQGFNAKPNYLELMFQDRDVTDTDYRIMDPTSQQWQRLEEQSQIRDYLNQNATGQFATDLAGMDDTQMMDYMNQQGWMKEAYDYGDPYQRSLYYTPYDVALGTEVGRVPGMTATGKTASTNWASIHPDVDYSFWDKATLANIGAAPGISDYSLAPTDGISAWQDPNVQNWNTGFITETNPWDQGIAADYEHGTGSYRTSSLFSKLGPILSFIPGLQPLGMAMSATSAIANKNPLAAAMAFMPMIPGLNTIGASTSIAASDAAQLAAQGLSASQIASIVGPSWGLGSTAASALANLGQMAPYATNALTGGIKSSIGGGDFSTGALGGAIGTGINQFVAPTVNKAFGEMGLSDDWAKGFTGYLSGLGTNTLTSYLSTIGDSDNFSESTSRLVSNTQSPFTGFAFNEGIESGFGLPQWMNQAQPEQQRKDTAKGVMTNNQLGSGFNPEKSTQYLVG